MRIFDILKEEVKKMSDSKRKKQVLRAVANMTAELTLDGFCWFIFHQPKVPQALLRKKKEK